MTAMRYLGVDPGGRRVGLAVGDNGSGIATPFAVIAYRGTGQTAQDLSREAERLGAACIVIGLPTNADGAESPSCRRSRALAEKLKALGLEVVFQSEFLTSREARERAREAGRSTGTPIDDLAAAVILEEFLAGLPISHQEGSCLNGR